MSPKKPHLPPHKHIDIYYGFKVQYVAEADSIPPLDALGIKRFQRIVGAILYYARAVDNKLLLDLSAIGAHHNSTTKLTSAATDQLLNYVTTYPNEGISYHISSMVFSGNSSASFLNKIKSNIRAGYHIFLYKYVPIQFNNIRLLLLDQIIKFVMSLAAKS